MRFFLLFLPLLLLLGLPLTSAQASIASCAPNAITSATVYTSYQVERDSFIAFTYNTYDDASAASNDCYPASASDEISIALIPTLSLYASVSSSIVDAYPTNLAPNDTNIFYGSNWMSSGLTASPAATWSLFTFNLRLQRVGNPGTIYLRLYGASSYLPPSPVTVLEQARALRGLGTFDGNRLSSSTPTDRLFYLDSAPTLAAGANNYVLVLSAPEGSCTGPCDGGIGDHYVIWRVETETASIGGSSVDSGLTWAAIAGGVHPHTQWNGRNLLSTFTSSDVLIEYVPDLQAAAFRVGEQRGTLYWPVDITPTPDHDSTLPNFVLAIINKDVSPAEPDAVYDMIQACQIVRIAPLSSGFRLLPITQVDEVNASTIPILSILSDIAPNLEMNFTSGFIILTLVLVILAMLLVLRFTSNIFILLFAALLPVIFMTMQGLLPGAVLVLVGLFAMLLLAWRVMVKQDV